jgi:hypothetical protein
VKRHLVSIFSVLVAANLTGQAVGCLVEPKTSQDALLDHCAGEARAAYYVGDASVDEAMRIYEACKARGGR